MEGHDLDWDTLIPEQYETMILDKIQAIGAERLKPLKEALPQDVSYLAIKAVLGKHKLGIG
jgi:ATP-dependent DNA helicase RecQ